MRRDRLSARFSAFARAKDGVAAVEFALVIPFLLMLLLGGFELTQAASTYRKLTDTTSELADIASQYTTMSSTDTSAVFNATSQIMYPNATGNLKIVLAEINTDANKNATVAWAVPYNGATAPAQNSSVTLPSGLAIASTSYIMVQSSYLYTPTIGSAFIKNIPFTVKTYMLPRQSTSIAYTG
jgi:Flp pilus assembly protein TadG